MSMAYIKGKIIRWDFWTHTERNSGKGRRVRDSPPRLGGNWVRYEKEER